MKKILGLLFIAGLSIANAGWVTSMQSATDKSIETEKRQLATYGINPRAYVFTVEAKDGAKTPMQCIIVYTEQDIGENKKNGSTAIVPAMQCIPLK
jgi:hypothetical protein